MGSEVSLPCSQKPASTNCTEWGLFWEADGRLTTQEIPNLLWNQKIHYRVNKSHQLARNLDPIFRDRHIRRRENLVSPDFEVSVEIRSCRINWTCSRKGLQHQR